MRRRGNEILWLLGTLVFFSWCVGRLYSQTIPVKQSAGQGYGQANMNFSAVPRRDTIRFLHPLLASRSVDSILEMMRQLSAQEAFKRAEMIVRAKNTYLTKEDKIQLIGGLARHFEHDKNAQGQFFTLLLPIAKRLAEKKTYPPVGYIMATFDDASVLKPLSAWRPHAHQKKVDAPFATIIPDALRYAAVQDDVEVFYALHKAGIQIDGSLASELLLILSRNPENSGKSVLFLKERGALVDQEDERGSTPLLYAIQQDNMPLVKTLLEQGANPNYLRDLAVGTPLQRAITKENLAIENMLRSFGAKD